MSRRVRQTSWGDGAASARRHAHDEPLRTNYRRAAPANAPVPERRRGLQLRLHPLPSALQARRACAAHALTPAARAGAPRAHPSADARASGPPRQCQPPRAQPYIKRQPQRVITRRRERVGGKNSRSAAPMCQAPHSTHAPHVALKPAGAVQVARLEDREVGDSVRPRLLSVLRCGRL